MKGQIRFLEDLDKIEKQKKDKAEQEKIFRAAKVNKFKNDKKEVSFHLLFCRAVRKQTILKLLN